MAATNNNIISSEEFQTEQEKLIVPETSTILVHTGNIVSQSLSRKTLSRTPSEELCMSLASTINTWVSSKSEQEKEKLKNIHSLEFTNEHLAENENITSGLTPDERIEMKITVKLFLGETREGFKHLCVKESIDRVLMELDTSYVDTVLLAIAPSDNRKLQLNDITEAWGSLEELVDNGTVFSLGVCDLELEQLQELYHWANVKPIVAQVKLDVCCAVPEDMQQFAKDNDVQLLTHNDPKDIVPVQSLKHGMSLDSFHGTEAHSYETLWVARYSALIKHRGILKNKGYIVKLERSAV